MINLPASIESRFWPKVIRRGADDCWEWVGALDGKGYGRMVVSRKRVSAHRVSWVIHNGKIPEGDGYHGTCVLHHCDNPKCVNPTHLFLGSNADNVADRDNKGRRAPPQGEKNPQAKLDEKTVLKIRALSGKATQNQIAARFGVSQPTVSRVILGDGWKHIA